MVEWRTYNAMPQLRTRRQKNNDEDLISMVELLDAVVVKDMVLMRQVAGIELRMQRSSLVKYCVSQVMAMTTGQSSVWKIWLRTPLPKHRKGLLRQLKRAAMDHQFHPWLLNLHKHCPPRRSFHEGRLQSQLPLHQCHQQAQTQSSIFVVYGRGSTNSIIEDRDKVRRAHGHDESNLIANINLAMLDPEIDLSLS